MWNPKLPGVSLRFLFNAVFVVSPGGSTLTFGTKTAGLANDKAPGTRAKVLLLCYQV